ncbi:hypothetical protein KU6B_47130 [Mameliella alba]|nr:hypothetical protein KU6B_47130 [Mameliella alba]
MFGDPVANSMGWDVVPIGNLGVVQGGLQVSRKREIHALRKPYLRVANVFRDLLDLAEVKEIGLTESEFERVKLQVGDILIVEGHGNPEEIGRTSVWTGEIEECVHQNHLIRFRADKSLVLPEFLSCLLNSPSGRRRLNSTSNTTSGLNTISTKKVKEAEVPLPPLAKQAEFLERFSASRAETKIFNAATQRFEDLFASLQHRAFQGEL